MNKEDLEIPAYSQETINTLGVSRLNVSQLNVLGGVAVPALPFCRQHPRLETCQIRMHDSNFSLNEMIDLGTIFKVRLMEHKQRRHIKLTRTIHKHANSEFV